jgi:hypothetical protein
MQSERWTIGLALFFAGASLVTLFVWIPADIETGVIETFRRRTTIGDAMAPTLAAAAILVISVIMGISAVLRARRNGRPPESGPDRRGSAFLLLITVPMVLGLVLMVYTGPVVVEAINAFGGEIGTYRQLKAAFPYKYLGYLIGGFVMAFGMIRVVENKTSQSAAWVSAFAVLALILLYDLPFENILLPPNGDF